MVDEIEDESGSSKDQDNQGRFSKAFRKPIGALKPEFKGKAEAKAQRIDEAIRQRENKAREITSKTRFVAGQSKEAIVKTTKETREFFKRKPREKGLGRFKSGLVSLKELPRRIQLRILTTEFPELARGIGKPILEPKFIPKRFFDVPRTAQWMAAAFLPIIIIVTMAIIIAIQSMIEEVLLNSGDLENQLPIFQFVVTFISLSLFILGVWSWFLWIRTGGFKQFDH